MEKSRSLPVRESDSTDEPIGENEAMARERFGETARRPVKGMKSP